MSPASLRPSTGSAPTQLNLALADEPSATPAAIERAQLQCRKLDVCKRAIAVQMGDLEELEEDATA